MVRLRVIGEEEGAIAQGQWQQQSKLVEEAEEGQSADARTLDERTVQLGACWIGDYIRTCLHIEGVAVRDVGCILRQR